MTLKSTSALAAILAASSKPDEALARLRAMPEFSEKTDERLSTYLAAARKKTARAAAKRARKAARRKEAASRGACDA